jgi:hypothetical protein
MWRWRTGTEILGDSDERMKTEILKTVADLEMKDHSLLRS